VFIDRNVRKIRNWRKYQTWQTRRRTKYLQRHRISVYKLRLRRGSTLGVQLKKSAKRKDRIQTATIKAPAQFSILHNPAETLKFLNEVNHKLRTRHLFVDMSGIAMLTAEAVAAFVAVMKNQRHENVKISGNVPSSPLLATKLEDFGFYDQVKRRGAPIETQRGTILLNRNRFQLARDNTVQSEIAGQMVDFARRIFPEDLHKGVFTMFMEATTNTVEHGSNSESPTQWVAGAYYDKDRNVMAFTVIDQGVGILNSVKFQKDMRALWRRATWSSGEKLRQLLLGNMRSRTKEPHRGLGLPGAFLAFKAGRISDLAIISNSGFAHSRAERYEELAVGFDGTIIYWEV
jgi:anti-sigma regulatory factor (Ser/Thr protein kinase)